MGTRQVPFSRVLYIEREDFREDPPRQFFRLAPGREVRLRYAYYITCTGVVKDERTGEVSNSAVPTIPPHEVAGPRMDARSRVPFTGSRRRMRFRLRYACTTTSFSTLTLALTRTAEIWPSRSTPKSLEVLRGMPA